MLYSAILKEVFMGYVASIFSLIFFIAALIPLFWGVHIIKLNLKSNINRSFFFLCIALSIWSFGFAMANSSITLESALFWRRFSAIGWTSIFSIILHFFLLITNEKQSSKLNKYAFLLYIPAIINMYIFAISSNMAMVQYNLIKIDYGWTNMAINNGWDYFYYLYYSLYMILSLAIVWNWKGKIKEEIKIRQAKIIFGAILSAAVLGGLIDLAANTFLAKPLPQMAPLFILLPVWAMYYPARYYDLVDYEKKYKNEAIITESEKQNIFYTIGVVFFIGGIFSFAFEYGQLANNSGYNLKVGIIRSIMFMVIGIAIYFIQKIKKSRLKEILTIVILVTNIPIITFHFLEYSSITIWAFPIIIMITALVFTKKTLLVSTAVFSIITQRLIWILRPEETVLVDKYDYILRIFLLVTAFLVGYYVNKIYVAKIEENDFQIRFQKMNAEISSDFISIHKENVDEKINKLLCKIGLFFEVDRTYLFLIDHGKSTMTYSYEWCNEGINPEVGTIENIPLLIFPWWIRQLKDKQLVYIEDTSKMPKEAINEQEQLLRQNVKSLISLPVKGEDGIKAFIGIDSVKAYRKWTKQDINLLNILANILSDALTKMESEKEIEYMAYYDNLTTLPNRFLFKDRVSRAIELSKEKNTSIYIIFIDLDNFKSVNDTIGHYGGDCLLREVGQSFKNMVRKTDTVGRFGGDEFMIMINDIENQKDVTRILDKIMEMFLEPFNIQGQEFFITASAGISSFPLDGEDPNTLIKNADTAMYEAKSKGKNRYEFCTINMKEEVEKNMTISNDLYYALERNELSLHYQPQMGLNKGEITGLEALLRWEHPELGMIPPKTFIPIAEKNGLINTIGEWVLKTACAQNKKWQDMGLGYFKMGVNLSGVQFINPNIGDQVERILKETGLEAKYLELEITESIAIKETDFVVEVLKRLKEIGVSIAIDDFGTEYSSLSRLKMLPIDRIKIDMEFIHGIEKSEKDKAITAIIINLAKSLGLNVLAEGVETGPQSEFLNQKMCDYVQGYYYYRPMPADKMEKILKEIKAYALI